MKRRAKTAETPEQDQDLVRLPPLLGIRPGVYLSVLYGLIIFVILGYLFIFPGISRPGALLEVVSVPHGAAVRIDDVYYAATPAQIFADAGMRTITVVLPGFESFNQTVEVGNRVIASRFFPKSIKIDAHLTEKAPLAALKYRAAAYAAWTFADEPTKDRQIPLDLSEGTYQSAPVAGQARPFLEAAARFMVTRAALKDLLRAEFIAVSGGQVPSPLTALAAGRDIFDYMQRNPAFTVALSDILPEGYAQKLSESALFPQVWADGGTKNAAFTAPRDGAPLAVANISFSARFSENTYMQNGGFQHSETVGPLYISIDEISVDAWKMFLDENPRWRLENKAALIAENLVDDNYLEPIASFPSPAAFFAANNAYPAPSQCGVSYYAAEAFSTWLNGKLPAALAAEFEVRLPTEAEWEYMAKFSEANVAAAAVPRHMTSRNGSAGLWEWCVDAWAPLEYLAAPPEAINALSSPERSVRGGSYVNQPQLVIAEMRASLPPQSCSPFTGFRVVIATKKTLTPSSGA
ncbi:MAG: SUMF1/EgtB/PvdO family nonheme iron enzyme [Spirochaetaceae bacterium]|jgi:formylglycine-generating enzyme required for sulfatase activity|nr:SUMF1/EgtB/PvdO family nonheme iron enzyme [Spirochaetaceae bacterium]